MILTSYTSKGVDHVDVENDTGPIGELLSV